MRGTFANVRLRNQIAPGTEGFTVHQPDNEQMSIFDAAMKYQEEGTPLIVIAGNDPGGGTLPEDQHRGQVKADGQHGEQPLERRPALRPLEQQVPGGMNEGSRQEEAEGEESHCPSSTGVCVNADPQGRPPVAPARATTRLIRRTPG